MGWGKDIKDVAKFLVTGNEPSKEGKERDPDPTGKDQRNADRDVSYGDRGSSNSSSSK